MMLQAPALPAKILRALLEPQDQDVVTSDLLEEYRDQAAAFGPREARSWYSRQVFGFLLWARWLPCCLRTAASWVTAFVAAATLAVSLPVYSPVPAVVVFLLAIPMISFYVANRTGNFRAALATAVFTCSAMLYVGALFIMIFQLRHPPLNGWALRVSGGILIAAACAFAGKASRETTDAIHIPR